MDALLTIVAVLFNYAGPFFLKQILEAIDNPSREARARAYVYALLTFLASLIKVRAGSHVRLVARGALVSDNDISLADPSRYAPPVVWASSGHKNAVPSHGRCL